MPGSFRELRAWQEAMQLTFAVYRETASFPKNELYELVQQMRRAVVSVPSNIAEGKDIVQIVSLCIFRCMREVLC